jgi:hypothetical protein
VPDIELKEEGWRAPYDNRPDQDRWWALFFNMFETRQAAVLQSFVNQLAALVPDIWDDKARNWEPDTESIRGMLGIIQSLNPKTTAQAALAAQLVALHLHQMKLAAGIANYGSSDARTVATMARVTKAFGEGMLTMQKLQGKVRKTKQIISVETRAHHHQHVHYEGGGPINGGRANATVDGGETISCAAMPGSDQTGLPLRIASRKRQTGVPDARGRKGKRGQERQG